MRLTVRGGRKVAASVAHSAQRFLDVEIGLEDLGDPVPALLEVGPAGVVDGQVLGLQHLADPAGDLLQVQPGQGAGVGRHRRVAAAA